MTRGVIERMNVMQAPERRHRRGNGGNQSSGTSAGERALFKEAMLLSRGAPAHRTTAEVEDSKASTLAERDTKIASRTCTSPPPSKVPILQQLLGTLPSPARSHAGISQAAQWSSVPCGPLEHSPKSLAASPDLPLVGVQWNSVPCGPPVHSPQKPLAAPAVPPPPPASPLPAPLYAAQQGQHEAPHTPALFDPSPVSYRDRLRAGGQGALQRAIHAGLMPKAMKQECGAPMLGGSAQGVLLPQPEMQSSMPTQCGTLVEGQNVWSGGHINDCWNQGQMPPQYTYMHGGPQMELQQMMPMSDQQLAQQMQQPQQFAQMPLQAIPQMGLEQIEMQHHMQMLQTPPCDRSPQVLQMQVPVMQANQSPNMFQMQGDQPPQMFQMQVPAHMQASQMQIPDMGVPQMQAPTPKMNGDGAPAEIDRCMAIIMPQAAQFQGDRDLMALQLRAAAECQCYED